MKYGLEGIKKSFGRQTVFDGLDFDFSKCGLYLIKGESGSGKTTLLNIIAGYEDFDGGKRVIEKEILSLAYYRANRRLTLCLFCEGLPNTLSL